MELNEKLQLLRKQKGITQEELAEKLYVSRTAVSKWESGRGTPNIDSLKALSKYFSISLDVLLSGDALLSDADGKRRERQLKWRDRMVGILDAGMLLMLILPLFGQRDAQAVRAVSLLWLRDIQPYLRGMYWAAIAGMGMLGALRIILLPRECSLWSRHKNWLSFAGGVALALLFALTRQPYATVFSAAALLMKGAMLFKSR
ncbi:MAG: helix-turn-helix transcriptional regulator [Clostridiales bacterium]|nr:helix-turn-helix transcriptional regulator [Clostridiales bacterium]